VTGAAAGADGADEVDSEAGAGSSADAWVVSAGVLDDVAAGVGGRFWLLIYTILRL